MKIEELLRQLPANLAESFRREDGSIASYRYELTIVKLHDSDQWQVAYRDPIQAMTLNREQGKGLVEQLEKMRQYVDANVSKPSDAATPRDVDSEISKETKKSWETSTK